MEYINLDLRIVGGSEGEYEVSAQSPAGEANGKVLMPAGIGASAGPAARGANAASREIVPTLDGVIAPPDDAGQEMSDLLLSGEIRDIYIRSRERARLAGQGLRIRLRAQDPRLSGLPWEYLHEGATLDFLCLSRETPVVRYLESATAPEALTVAPPLSILGVIAAPSDLPSLDVDAERKRIEEATAPLRGAGLLKLTWLAGSTARDLMKSMRQGPFHVLHFVGHGDFDSKADEGTIALTDDAGKSAPLKASDLARLLGDHEALRMVVLNSCYGAKVGMTQFSSTASALIARGVPAVVAMQYAISDRAALVFARELYESIADQIPIDAAVTEARKAIRLVPECRREWVTPVLHMRSPDGSLFSIAGKKTSDFKEEGGFELLGGSAPPPATIGAVMALWSHRAIVASVAIAFGVLLNFAIVIGTDTRLGTDYRPMAFVDRFPVFTFLSDAARSVVTSATRHYFIALAIFAAVGVLAYLFRIIWRADAGATGESAKLRAVRSWLVRPGHPALSAFAVMAALSGIVLAYSSAPLTNQLNGPSLTTVSRDGGSSGDLARAQVCRALANDDATIASLDVKCAGSTAAERIEWADDVVRGWLAVTTLLAVIALAAAIMSRRGPRAAGFRTRWPRANALSIGASVLAFTAVVGLAFSYGILVRPLRPPYIGVNDGDTICEGYLLANRANGLDSLYNPASGLVEGINVANPKPISAADGRVPDIIQQRLAYAVSEDKALARFKSCNPPEA